MICGEFVFQNIPSLVYIYKKKTRFFSFRFFFFNFYFIKKFFRFKLLIFLSFFVLNKPIRFHTKWLLPPTNRHSKKSTHEISFQTKKSFFAVYIHAIRSLQNKTHLFEIDCIIESHHIVLMKRWVIAEVRRVLPQPALHILAIHLSFCLSGNRIRKSCKRQCSGIPQHVCPSKLPVSAVSSTTCADCERTVYHFRSILRMWNKSIAVGLCVNCVSLTINYCECECECEWMNDNDVAA